VSLAHVRKTWTGILPEALPGTRWHGYRLNGTNGKKRADQVRTRNAVGPVTNAALVSTTDPEARLYRKGSGKEAKLSFMGHAMTENRNGRKSAPRRCRYLDGRSHTCVQMLRSGPGSAP
jgi:hypothetical protein